MQLPVDERDEPVQGTPVPLPPGEQQPGDLARRGGGFRALLLCFRHRIGLSRSLPKGPSLSRCELFGSFGAFSYRAQGQAPKHSRYVLVNENGQVAGFGYTNAILSPETRIPTVGPFLWDNGQMIDLGSLEVFGGVSGLNKKDRSRARQT